MPRQNRYSVLVPTLNPVPMPEPPARPDSRRRPSSGARSCCRRSPTGGTIQPAAVHGPGEACEGARGAVLSGSRPAALGDLNRRPIINKLLGDERSGTAGGGDADHQDAVDAAGRSTSPSAQTNSRCAAGACRSPGSRNPFAVNGKRPAGATASGRNDSAARLPAAAPRCPPGGALRATWSGREHGTTSASR